jgi:hypothetical protein
VGVIKEKEKGRCGGGSCGGGRSERNEEVAWREQLNGYQQVSTISIIIN